MLSRKLIRIFSSLLVFGSLISRPVSIRTEMEDEEGPQYLGDEAHNQILLQGREWAWTDLTFWKMLLLVDLMVVRTPTSMMVRNGCWDLFDWLVRSVRRASVWERQRAAALVCDVYLAYSKRPTILLCRYVSALATLDHYAVLGAVDAQLL